MSLPCKTLRVTLSEFNTADTFEVAIRPAGTLQDFDNSFKQTATSRVVMFREVLGTYWEVQVRRTCAGGGVYLSPWQEPSSTACAAPAGLVVTPTSATAAQVEWTGTAPTHQWMQDFSGTWQSATSPLTLFPLISGPVYTVHLRGRCGDGTVTTELQADFTTQVAAPHFSARVLRINCEAGYYLHHLVRFSLSGGVAPAGSRYKVTYQVGTQQLTLLDYTVKVGDTLADIVEQVAGVVSPERVVTTDEFGYVDFQSRNLAPGQPQNLSCAQASGASFYQVSIV
jgi:hypothetical protein